MYYNLTEDEKVFYETSYSLLKAGYTNEEIVEFWSNDNEEEVEFILESLEYVDINRKDLDFVELNEGLGAVLQYGLKGLQYVPKVLQGLKTAYKVVTNPITRRAASNARNLARYSELAALTRPRPAQIKLANTLQRQLDPNKTKNIVRQWKPDNLTTVRSGSAGSSTYRGNASQIQPTPATPPVASAPKTPPTPPAAPVTPKTPVGPKIKNTLITTGVGVGVGAGLINNRAGDVPVVKPTEVEPTETKVEPTETKVEPTEVKTPEVKPRKTDPDKNADQDNVDSAGNKIEIGTEVGGPEFARPAPKNTAPETTVPKTPKTQVTSPSRKKPRFSFGTYDRSRQSRDGVTGGVNNSYEYAIDKLISEGHASSIEEAEYVFKQLDDDFIKALIS